MSSKGKEKTPEATSDEIWEGYYELVDAMEKSEAATLAGIAEKFDKVRNKRYGCGTGRMRAIERARHEVTRNRAVLEEIKTETAKRCENMKKAFLERCFPMETLEASRELERDSIHSSNFFVQVEELKVQISYWPSIICEGDYNTCLLNLFLAHSEKSPWMQSKLMVVGKGRCGKTATVRSLLGENFKDELDSTIGVSLTEMEGSNKGKSLFNKVDQHRDPANESFARAAARAVTKVLKKTPTIESENKKELSKPLERKKDLLYPRIEPHRPKPLGFDFSSYDKLSAKEDAAKIIEAMDLFMKNLRSQHDIETQFRTGEDVSKSYQRSKKLIPERESVNTKDPWTNSEISYIKPTAFESTMRTRRFDEDSIRYTIWDYGGQDVFYSLHHLFLTKYGVYLLVFDMRDLLGEEITDVDMKDIIFWLNSVKLHAPEAPIILVGTFGDLVDDKRDLKLVHERLQAVVKSFNVVHHESEMELCFYPLNNKTQKGSVEIRNAILKATRAQDYIQFEVPLKWLRTLDLVLKESEPWIYLSKVKEIAKDLDINSNTEIESMLRMFHELGVLIYMTETEALRNVIVRDPQWLVSSIGRLIRDESLHPYDVEKIHSMGLSSDVESLFRDAIASQDLLAYLWDGNQEETDFLLDLMRRTCLLIDWEFDKDADQRHFLVPSLLSESEETKANVYLHGEPQDPLKTLKFCFEFSNPYLPSGVFERVICLAVSNSGRSLPLKSPMLNKSSSVVWFGEDKLVLWMENTAFWCKAPDNSRINSHLSVLNSIMHKINYEVMHKALEWEVNVQSDTSHNGLVPLETAQKQQLKPWCIDVQAQLLDLDALLEEI